MDSTQDSYIDWNGCERVERIPAKVSGRPVVCGTRILADTIVQDAELGSPVEEVHENYPDLAVETNPKVDCVCANEPGAARCVRVLPDHNLPHGLRTAPVAFTKHEVVTAGLLGWGDLTNGKLLQAIERHGFDVFVTGGGSLRYEQNLGNSRLFHSRVVEERMADPEVPSGRDGARHRSGARRELTEVDCGHFQRKSPGQ